MVFENSLKTQAAIPTSVMERSPEILQDMFTLTL